MFCNKCGNEISNDSKFCSQCGAVISQDRLPFPTYQASNSVKETARLKTDVNSRVDKTIDRDYGKHNQSKIEMNSIKCPACGGVFSCVDGLDTYFCVYCGNKVVLSGFSEAAYNAKVSVKKLEQQERLASSVLSHEKEMFLLKNEAKKQESKHTMVITIVCLVFILLLIGVPLLYLAYPRIKSKSVMKKINSLNEEVDELIDDEDYDEAEKVNKQLKKKIKELEGNEWCDGINLYLENYYEITQSQREEDGKDSKKIELNIDLEDLDDMTKEDVVEYLIKSGFVNISCVVEDADALFSTKWGSVDEVSIDGYDDWEAGEVFSDDVEVIVKVWTE